MDINTIVNRGREIFLGLCKRKKIVVVLAAVVVILALFECLTGCSNVELGKTWSF